MSDKPRNIKDIVHGFIYDVPLSQWGDYLERLALDSTDLQEAEDMASSLSVKMGMLAEYLGFRGAFGLGDSGHEKAMERTRKARVHLRRANGYSYPER